MDQWRDVLVVADPGECGGDDDADAACPAAHHDGSGARLAHHHPSAAAGQVDLCDGAVRQQPGPLPGMLLSHSSDLLV